MTYPALQSTEELRWPQWPHGQTDSRRLATTRTYYKTSARAKSQSYRWSPSKSAGAALPASGPPDYTLPVALTPVPTVGWLAAFMPSLHGGVRKAGNLMPLWGRQCCPTCL